MVKAKIRKFRGLKDYYMSYGMQPYDNGRAIIVSGRFTSSEIEGDLSNFDVPIAYGYERTRKTLVILCNGGYVFTSPTGMSHLSELGHNTGYDNNMIVDQNDNIWVFSDTTLKYWSTVFPRVWTNPSYTFTNGTDSVFHPAALIQDYIIIGDGNVIARIDTSSGSYAVGDFTAAALTLPAGYEVSAITQKGATYREAIIAANRNKKGYIITWNCISDQPNSIIIFDEEVLGLTTTENNKTYAIVGNGVLYDISAYPIMPVFTPPDNEKVLQTGSVLYEFKANSLASSKGKIYMGMQTNGFYDRHKNGLWVYDIDSKQGYMLCPSSSQEQHKGYYYSLFPAKVGTTTEYSMFLGTRDNSGLGRHDYYNVGPLVNGAFYISPKISDVKSQLRGIKFNVYPDLTGHSIQDFNISILASYYTFDRTLWGHGLEDGEASANNTLQLGKLNTDTGSNTLPEVGDEITVLSKTNAGYIRRVTAVNTDSDPYVITLDSDMAGKTEDGVFFNVQPFKKFNTTARTITEGGEVYIDCPDRPEFRNLLVKLEFRITTGIPVMSDLDIIYDRLPDPR